MPSEETTGEIQEVMKISYDFLNYSIRRVEMLINSLKCGISIEGGLHFGMDVIGENRNITVSDPDLFFCFSRRYLDLFLDPKI